MGVMPGHDHGPSIKNPTVYEALRRKGMDKSKAAAISNAQRWRGRKKKKGAAVAKDDEVLIEKVDFSMEVPISKVDDEKRIAFGWASVAITKDGEVVLDRQEDFIDDLTELEDAAYDFVTNSRVAGEQHARKGVGSLVESFVVTPEKLERMGLEPDALPLGWWTGFHVADDDVWAGVKDGKYPMLSVHGTGRREVVQ